MNKRSDRTHRCNECRKEQKEVNQSKQSTQQLSTLETIGTNAISLVQSLPSHSHHDELLSSVFKQIERDIQLKPDVRPVPALKTLHCLQYKDSQCTASRLTNDPNKHTFKLY